MGCDIHPYVEVRQPDGTWADKTAPELLHNRTYGRFAFLTGGEVRNYSGVPEVLPKPRGYPNGFKYQDEDGFTHSASYLTLAELLAVDYDQTFVDVRDYDDNDKFVTLRYFLGEGWEEIITELQTLGKPEDVRIVFDFDN